jgi:thiopurine S-methyltransferase
VTGVEFVRKAAEAFFEERALTPDVEPWQGLDALSANGVRIAVGDFFALSVPEAERFDTAYDRAALIAVRPEDRERYVATCLAALRPGARLLIVTLDFGDAPLAGPPFGVSERDVRRLYADAKVEALAETDISASEPGLRERGASRVLEQAWLVRLPG